MTETLLARLVEGSHAIPVAFTGITDKLANSAAARWWTAGAGLFIISLFVGSQVDAWVDARVDRQVSGAKETLSVQIDGLRDILVGMKGDFLRLSENHQREIEHLRGLVEQHMLNGKND